MTRAAIIRIDRYSRGAIAFHWVIAALVLFNLVTGLLHENLLDGVPVMATHMAIGITVIALTLGRIAWRLAHPVPPVPGSMKPWERLAAKALHFLFYALLLIVPLSGWAMRSGGPRARPVDWFGLFDVPMLPVSTEVAGLGDKVHSLLGIALAALVALHIAAALRHHFILRDRVLARMWPGLL